MTTGLGVALVGTARQIADEVLAPAAEQADREGVPPSSIAAIKESGLLGLNAPVESSGSAAPAEVVREVAEILAGACCSTWLVQTEHHTPVRMLAAAVGRPVRDRLVRPLATGELLSGIAFAHLRSYPRIPVRAVPDRDGWRLHGRVPWYTGWGLNDVMLLAGVAPEGEVVFAITEAREQQGLRPSAPMRLAALTGSRTVSLEIDGLPVPDESVVLRTPYETWATADRLRNINVGPPSSVSPARPWTCSPPLGTRTRSARRPPCGTPWRRSAGKPTNWPTTRPHTSASMSAWP